MTKRKVYGLEPIEEHSKHVKQAVIQKIKGPQKQATRKIIVYPIAAICTLFVIGFLWSQLAEDNRIQTVGIQPELDVTIGPLSEQERNQIGKIEEADRFANVTKDDFKVLNLKYHIKKNSDVSHVEVEFPANLTRDIFDEFDGVSRYWHGSSSEQNNDSEDFAHYEYRIVFYDKDLTEEQIIKTFNEMPLVVTWQNTAGDSVTEEIFIGDYIQFKELKMTVEDIYNAFEQHDIAFVKYNTQHNEVFSKKLNGVTPTMLLIQGKPLYIFVYDSKEDVEKALTEFEDNTASMELVSYEIYKKHNYLLFYVHAQDLSKPLTIDEDIRAALGL